ncbi:hypothetical protein BDQ17DRAFT_1345798 [Cyathus striatus]|nr:hypothetical protein BDQ17DRAFT_1345798 [Cyathus striatus]
MFKKRLTLTIICTVVLAWLFASCSYYKSKASGYVFLLFISSTQYTSIASWDTCAARSLDKKGRTSRLQTK